jgi:site-specific DNA-methyltransferase (adenine-specific)
MYSNRKDCNPKLGGFKYPPMSQKELKALPIQDIADDDCALCLWATMPKLQEALDVIEAWGFKYTTCLFNWVKKNPLGVGIYSGMGHYTNGNAELVLFGKKGRPQRVEKNVKQIQMHPRGRHSAKPPEIRDEIVRLFGDKPRIELFARDKTEGWDVIGNDIDGKDIKTVLEEMVPNSKI